MVTGKIYSWEKYLIYKAIFRWLVTLAMLGGDFGRVTEVTINIIFIDLLRISVLFMFLNIFALLLNIFLFYIRNFMYVQNKII